MFEQAFRNIDDALRKEAGCTTELDYTEQTSWLLFLKYLDGLERDKADEAALDGRKYTYILAAKANAEKNLRNASALLAGYLGSLFDRQRPRCKMERLDALTELFRGHNSPKSKFSYVKKPGYVRF